MFDHVELEFEELETTNIDGQRVYQTPDGNFPSITTVLGRKKAQFFKEWRQRIGEEEANKITTQATRRGTSMHTIVEKYIANETDYFGKSLPNVRSMFNTIKPFIDSHLNNIAGIEIPLWSKQLGIAGRCDCVGDWKGEKAILDWKTSGKIKKKEWVEDYFLQATAYSIMFEERTGIPINSIVIVMAVENEEPQVFEEKTPDYWKLLETTLKEWK
jgi:genome maintenance exonuclease 1